MGQPVVDEVRRCVLVEALIEPQGQTYRRFSCPFCKQAEKTVGEIREQGNAPNPGVRHCPHVLKIEDLLYEAGSLFDAPSLDVRDDDFVNLKRGMPQASPKTGHVRSAENRP